MKKSYSFEEKLDNYLYYKPKWYASLVISLLTTFWIVATLLTIGTILFLGYLMGWFGFLVAFTFILVFPAVYFEL
jgi:hypothetical protein